MLFIYFFVVLFFFNLINHLPLYCFGLCCSCYYYNNYYYLYNSLSFLLFIYNKVRTAWLIVPYNDGSEVTIQLCTRGRSCLAFANSEIFSIPPKEKFPCLFKPFSIQKYVRHLYVRKDPLGGLDIRDYVNAYNFRF